MVKAIELELEQSDWQAGERRVAFQACDDSVAETGEWDKAKCEGNARAYADNPDVIGVIGTYNSGCAEAMLPILNRATGGAVPIVSPGNTLVCLTETAKTCENGEPESLYPTKDRNYARVVPNDAVQGAALATFAEAQGIRRVFVLRAADDPTSLGQASTFKGAAKQAGLKIAGEQTWDPEASDYADLMKSVKLARADALLLAGLLEQNGAQLIKDKVKVLGPNDGDVKLLAPDGFAQQATIDDAGKAAKGMFTSVPTRPPEKLKGPGKAFVKDLEGEIGTDPVEPFAPYAGQATEVMLKAIEKGGGERSGTVEALFGIKIKDGIVGSFKIVGSGDSKPLPITVSVAEKTFKTEQEINPAANLIRAARD
jgi:branched-chain amino acid transport system substrate-binding protein